MQTHRELPLPRIDRDLLAFVQRAPPRWFWIAAAGLGALVGAAVVAEVVIILFGLRFLGYTNTVYWSVLITNFIFWVGVSHAGVMMSAILRLTEAEWRRPITRAAEVLAISSLVVASIFPLIHTGRVWRTIYWIWPYDFAREAFPNIRSPLIWDPSALVTYITGTILFAYVDLIPDLAAARDRSEGLRRAFYAALAMGFRGYSRQWRTLRAANRLLSALILLVFIMDYSIVAWDLSMAILPGWHSTGLAPFFVLGGVYSGVAGVVIVMVFLRRALRLHNYIRPEHFDVVGRLQMVVALAYLFFFVTELYFGLFRRDPVELRIWELRLTTPPTSWLFYGQFLMTLVVPLPIWLVPRFRRSVRLMLLASIAVNVGTFLERYLLVITPQLFKHPFTFLWDEAYQVRPIEYVFTLGTIGLSTLGVLLFAKMFPIIPIWGVKEGQVVSRRLVVGRAEVPATIRK